MIALISLFLGVSVAFSSPAPKQWDWTNINGTNYVTTIRNYNLPAVCNAGWAFAALGCLQDRLKFRGNNTAPEVQLSPQNLLDCSLAGNCLGGSLSEAFNYIEKTGVVSETCAPYQSKTFVCDKWNTCLDCPSMDTPCSPVQDPPRVKISGHRNIVGEEAMAVEIFKGGPIACSCSIPVSLYVWDNGFQVFYPDANEDGLSSAVRVVGYGVSSKGEKYWTVDPGFGTFWNNSAGGFFWLLRGVDGLAIESSGCEAPDI